MAQVAINERLDLVRETAREVIAHQKGKDAGPVAEFLDKLTTDLLCDSIFRKQDWVRDSGLFGILFPREYGERVRDKERKSNAPYMQQIECIVTGSEKTAIELEFHFLQPVVRVVKQWNDAGGGKGRWTRPSAIEVDGKRYNKSVDNVVRRVVADKVLIAEILDSRKTILIKFDDKETNTDITDAKGRLAGRFTYEVPKVSGMIQVLAKKLNTQGHYKVTMRVTNTSTAKSEEAEGFMEEQVAKKSFYGTYAKIRAKEGKIVSPIDDGQEFQRELRECANVNTSPVLSKAEENLLFASPIILHDFPKYEPVKMDVTLTELCGSEDTLMQNMDMLGTAERKKFADSGKIKIFRKVVRALSKTKPEKIKTLYLFQWVGIQHFVKKLISGDSVPLMIRAPTDSGKSIIFYVCAVLMKLFNDDATGTVTFITFPTRALNSQQFSEMIDFFYQLNKEGLKVTLGLYMGSEWGSDRDVAVRTYWPPSVKPGDEITDVDRCPKCGSDNIIAHKPHERRMIPKCGSCGEELDFIYLSNMETEEFCPNVIVGTPDKIIYSLTASPWSHTIFGAPSKRCPNCSRFVILSWSNQGESVHKCKYCSIDLGPETLAQSTPRFVVFDEVHTLSGTQGNLLGQFLSLMRVVNKKYNLSDEYWYLGATATIANQQDLVKNLTDHTTQLEFPTKQEFPRYFTKRLDKTRHRYLVLEPLGRTTRWSVSTVALDAYSILRQTSEADAAIIKKLNEMGLGDASQAYKIQTIYVLRKTDGRNLEKWVPDWASRKNIPIPLTQFGSGDLPRSELVSLNKKVRDLKLDVLIVTQIYGQGVDFPGLNIIHFFGVPRSFIELMQVVGRTGRRELPGIVLIHLQPEMPRDQWVYKHFREVIESMEELYEPVPINVMNRFAIALSLPNVLNALLTSRMSKDYRMRFADYCSKNFGEPEKLRELLDEILEVYMRSWADSEKERDRLRKLIFARVRELLLDFRSSKYDTTQALKFRHMLLMSLRDPSKEVPYTDSVSFPLLDGLQFKEPDQNVPEAEVTESA